VRPQREAGLVTGEVEADGGRTVVAGGQPGGAEAGLGIEVAERGQDAAHRHAQGRGRVGAGREDRLDGRLRGQRSGNVEEGREAELGMGDSLRGERRQQVRRQPAQRLGGLQQLDLPGSGGQEGSQVTAAVRALQLAAVAVEGEVGHQPSGDR
jgi:hypothetical protein